MVMMFGPIARMESRSDSSKPRMSDVMPTIAVMPITTPSTVSADRIMLTRSVSAAMTTTSRIRPARTGITVPSFPPERFDRVEARRAHRRIETEEESDERRDADSERHGPRLDGGRHRCEGRDEQGKPAAQRRPDHAAEQGEDD